MIWKNGLESLFQAPRKSCRYVHLGRHPEDEFRVMTTSLRRGKIAWVRVGERCSGQQHKGEHLAYSGVSVRLFAEGERDGASWHPGTGQHNPGSGGEVWSWSGLTDWQKDVLSCLFVPFQCTLLPATVLRVSTCVLSSPEAGVVSPQVWTWRSWPCGWQAKSGCASSVPGPWLACPCPCGLTGLMLKGWCIPKEFYGEGRTNRKE